MRWSAAKGIGRITSRFTYSLSDEVLSSVLELFSPGEVCMETYVMHLSHRNLTAFYYSSQSLAVSSSLPVSRII